MIKASNGRVGDRRVCKSNSSRVPTKRKNTVADRAAHFIRYTADHATRVPPKEIWILCLSSAFLFACESKAEKKKKRKEKTMVSLRVCVPVC